MAVSRVPCGSCVTGRRVYLTRRRPCWVCSSALAVVTTGEHAGQYAATEAEIDGFPRYMHDLCATGLYRALEDGRCACDVPGPGNEIPCHASYYGKAATINLATGELIAECRCSCHRCSVSEVAC